VAAFSVRRIARRKEWLGRPGCRIKLRFFPAYCPHLNPIERLWGVMHKNITHNKCYEACGEFAEGLLQLIQPERVTGIRL